MLDVYITIDAECSIGGAWDHPSVGPVTPERSVLGQIGVRFYGTPLIMDILEESGLKGTFFVETLAAYNVGEAQLASAYRQIVDRGHSAHLHLHPVHYYYSQVQRRMISREQVPPNCDVLATHSRETQCSLLQDGIRLFERMIGKKPTEFRAGNYGASALTLEILAQLGIRCDSSCNAAYLGSSCHFDAGEVRNSPWRHHGVWEIPVTNFHTGLGKGRGSKPMEISAISTWEMCNVLEQADRLGLGTVTFILHSFSLFKRLDRQYRDLRPDRLVIGRLRNICRFLASRPEQFRVVTFEDQVDLAEKQQQSSFPDVGAAIPTIRKIVQAVNSLYWI